MKRLTLFTTACVLAVLALFATTMRAQQPDTLDRTSISFASAVELPGVTLEPGEYEFRLADTPSRNVVQVFRKSDSKVMGQWTFVQAERERTSDDTVVMFKEAREGATPAVQYWYYPTEKIGKEFIYPKDQAERIAARTGQSVRTEAGVVSAPASATASANTGSAIGAADRDGASASSAASASPAASASSAQAESTLRNAPASAQPTAAAGSGAGNRGITATPAPASPAPARAEAQTDAAPVFDAQPRPVGTSGAEAPAPVAAAPQAQAQPQQQAQPQPRPEPAPPAARAAELPRTASPLPISAVIGLLSLAGAALLRFRHS